MPPIGTWIIIKQESCELKRKTTSNYLYYWLITGAIKDQLRNQLSCQSRKTENLNTQMIINLNVNYCWETQNYQARASKSLCIWQNCYQWLFQRQKWKSKWTERTEKDAEEGLKGLCWAVPARVNKWHWGLHDVFSHTARRF